MLARFVASLGGAGYDTGETVGDGDRMRNQSGHWALTKGRKGGRRGKAFFVL